MRLVIEQGKRWVVVPVDSVSDVEVGALDSHTGAWMPSVVVVNMPGHRSKFFSCETVEQAERLAARIAMAIGEVVEVQR